MHQFSEERFIPKGGPNGGDGGKGGDVILEAHAQLSTLLDLSYPQQLRAPKDRTVKEKTKQEETERTSSFRFPQGLLSGTMKQEKSSRTWLWKASAMWPPREVEEAGKCRFATSTRRVLGSLNKGRGAKLLASLELKLLADVGLIGYPTLESQRSFPKSPQQDLRLRVIPSQPSP